MMFWILVLGIATGMRCMTPIAVLCWFMWMGRLPVTHFNFWTANAISTGIFTLFALGEYYGDTLASTPSRKAAGPAISRVVFAAGVGALVASSYLEPLAGGIILGTIGALIGTWGGYWARMTLAKLVGKDLPVALAESALALGMSVLAMHSLAVDVAIQAREALLRF